MATFTRSVTYSAYNAFNPYGYGTASSEYVWHGWNGSKVNNQFGFAGLRTNGTIHYAFAYRFTTPSWSGTVNKISFTIKLNRETSAATNIICSLTPFDPTSNTTSYTSSTVLDPYRIGYKTLSLNSGDNSYTVEFDVSSLSKNATYYLVLSPNGGATNYATISTLSFSGYITYEADATEVSADNGYIGSGIAITMTNDGMSHVLTYEFEGATGSIATTTNASYTWTPPNSLMNRIPAASSGSCTIICTTEAGETETTITLYVPDSVKPRITGGQFSPVNENATVRAWNIWLQNFTKANGTLQATASYSTITSWRIDAGAVVFTGTDLDDASIDISEISAVLTTAGTFSVTWSVTDARGRTTTARASAQYTVRPYAYPSVSNPEIYRCLQDGTRDDKNGTYLYVKATRIYSAVGSNTCSMVVQYKERTQDESQYITFPSSGSMSDNTGYIIGGGEIDILKSYNIRIYVQDALGGSYYAIVISTQSVAFNLKPSQDSGAGFGGYAQDDKILELFNDWKLRVPSSEHILVFENSVQKTLKELIEEGGGGGGGGGTSDYNALSNKPSINNVSVSGNHNGSYYGLEDTNNKVTSINSSSTDSQYPSAKCVYTLIGDIEAALAALR